MVWNLLIVMQTANLFYQEIQNIHSSEMGKKITQLHSIVLQYKNDVVIGSL